VGHLSLVFLSKDSWSRIEGPLSGTGLTEPRAQDLEGEIRSVQVRPEHTKTQRPRGPREARRGMMVLRLERVARRVSE
jgi:hypothetical protein